MGSRLEKGSDSVRKRIQAHTFEDEEGEEYDGSKFGGFSEYFRRKKLKLQNLDKEVRSASRDLPAIFRGIVAHVNGYTQPSLNDLHHIIVSHGGGFMQYLDGKTTVTHVIAANLTPKKAIEFRRYRIVKPAWVVDSVKAGKLLPWDAYRVLHEGVGQKILGFNEGRMVSQSNTQQRSYREQTSTSWYTGQVNSVAEDVDGGEGAHSLTTRPGAMNAIGEHIDNIRIREQTRTPGRNQISGTFDDESQKGTNWFDDFQDPSASFDVTSSLEDALNNALENGDVDSLKQPKPESPTAQNSLLPEASTLNRKHDSASLTETNELSELADLATTSIAGSPVACAADLSSPVKKDKALTPEDHNAVLLSDPHIRKSSTANPDFLKQYYSESRLHHLSTWKADLKSRFQAMAAEKSASQKQNLKRKPGSRRYVMHVDFDSFFCAVSLRNAPEYVDTPTVVAHGSGSGSEIASCNYPARAFGVKNGMWMKKALVLCPNIKVLPYDFPAYEEASQEFYEAVIDVGGIVQSVSIDEALIDVTSLVLPAGASNRLRVEECICREQEKADQIARHLRAQIKEKTGCAVSIGIGENILLAKVALRKAKPAGQHQIKPEDILDFVGELSVQDLPGVAWSIGGKLDEIGIKFVKDIRQLTKDRLMTVLGPKTGEKIWEYARGIDRTEVGDKVVRKSVSAEVNWGIRFISQPEAEEFIMNLCKELQRRLIEQRVKGRQLTMKIMKKTLDAPLDPPKHLGHGKCDTFNKSIVLGVATTNADTLGKEAVSILRSYGFSPGELRGLGVQMQKLEPLNIAVPDGSQRRINFDTAIKQQTNDPIDDSKIPIQTRNTSISPVILARKAIDDSIDDTSSPQKMMKPAAGQLSFSDDPIDDIDSPKKPKTTPIHPATAIARANASDQGAKKPLNLTGTQFVMPTQVDPSVLAELPQDIRSKLSVQRKHFVLRNDTPTPKSRSHSPARGAFKPLPSQLDPNVFSALPEEMKAEILASYTSAAGPFNLKGQALLPTSPRKPLPAPPSKQPRLAKLKKRGRPPGSRNSTKQDLLSSLKQSAFISKKPTNDRYPGLTPTSGSDDVPLDPEFLSALPEEMRLEMLTEHRRKRLAKKSNLLTTTTSHLPQTRKPPDPSTFAIQRKLRLPARPPRPTFTTMELSKLPELREMLSKWFREFSDEGPHPADVAAVERYLKRVVLDERDTSKVVGVVKWIQWLIDDCDDVNEGKGVWAIALEEIKEQVQEAVEERGLGRLEL